MEHGLGGREEGKEKSDHVSENGGLESRPAGVGGAKSSHGDGSGNMEHGLGGREEGKEGEEYATQRGSEAKNISDGGELGAGGTGDVHMQREGPSYMHHEHIRGLGVRPHPPSMGSGRTPQGAKETGSRHTRRQGTRPRARTLACRGPRNESSHPGGIQCTHTGDRRR